MSSIKIGGSMVALVTPMSEDGHLDLPAYRALIDWHIAEGTDAIVVVGTSGESPTVSMDENAELISIAVEHCKKRIPVIAGAGANSTAEAIALSQHAQKVGADAILSVVPYYNKPTQEGIYQHFKAIAEKVSLPIVLYNVPGRTVADMSNATIIRCAQIDNIIGVKDATGDISRGIQLIQQAPTDFDIYSGDDATAAALILMGGKGNISVTANVAPKLMSQLCAAALAHNVPLVQSINKQLGLLNTHLFLEANPIPVKWALAAMGKIPYGCRLPLTVLSEVHRPKVKEALAFAGINV